MYKHNAESIKENNNKMFISNLERQTYNNKADITHEHNDLYYNKEDIDYNLDTVYVTKKDTVVNSPSLKGFVKELEIFGNSKHRVEELNIDVVTESGAISDRDGSNVIIYDENNLPYECYRSIDYIEVVVGDNITCSLGKLNVRYYDKNKNYISGEYIDKIIILSSDIKYIRFYGGTGFKDSVGLNIKRTYCNEIISVGKKVGENLYTFDVVSCGENIAKPGILADWTYESSKSKKEVYASPIYNIKPNTEYCFSVKNIMSGGLTMLWLDEDNNFISRALDKRDNTTVVSRSPQNARKVQLYVYENGTEYDRNTNMELNEWLLAETKNNLVVKYSKYLESVKSIQIPYQLEGISNRHDKLYIDKYNNLILEKKIVTKYLDEITYWSGLSTTNDLTIAAQSYTFSSDTDNSIKCIITDMDVESVTAHKVYNTTTVTECIGMNVNGHLQIRLSRDRLKNHNLNIQEYLNYMKSEGTRYKFKYPASEPTLINLGPIGNFTVQTFDNITNISLYNTDTIGNVSCKLPMTIGGTISSNINALDMMKKEVDNLNKLVSSNNMVIESNTGVYNIIESKTGSYVDNIRIEGETLFNLSPLPNNEEFIVSGINSYDNSLIEYDTEYTIFVNVLDTSNLPSGSSFVIEVHSSAYRSKVYIDKQGPFVGKIKTLTDSKNFTLWIKNGGTVTIKDLVVVKGDHTDKSISYFKGLQSISPNIDLISLDKNSNLFDKNKYVADTTIAWAQGINNHEKGSVASDFIPVHGGMNLKSNKLCQYMYYDANKNYIGHGLLNNDCISYKEMTIPNNVQYLKVSARPVSNGNSNIDPNELIVSIDSINKYNYNTNIQHIMLSEPLRGIPGGVKDTIEKIDGKYYVVRRCGEKILNGTETNWTSGHETTKCKLFQCSTNGTSAYLKPCIANGFISKTSIYQEDIEYIVVGIDFNIKISKSKIGGSTVDNLKNWLRDNNLTVVYELNEPILEPLNQDISIPVFDGITKLMVLNQYITPYFKAEVTTSLANTLKVAANKIEELEKFNNLTNRIKLRSLFESNRTRFDIDVLTTQSSEYCNTDYDLYKLFIDVISVGKHNYDRYILEDQIDFYTIIGKFNFDMSDMLYTMIESQHNDIDMYI